jgi:hypothetical protein
MASGFVRPGCCPTSELGFSSSSRIYIEYTALCGVGSLAKSLTKNCRGKKRLNLFPVIPGDARDLFRGPVIPSEARDLLTLPCHPERSEGSLFRIGKRFLVAALLGMTGNLRSSE